MEVLGQCEIQLSTTGDRQDETTKTTAIVADQVSHPALIRWHDLQPLKIIPPVLPASACHTSSLSNIKEKLFSKYDLVFSDSLLPEPMLGEKVKIKLKPDSVPSRMSVAQQIPLQFEEPAGKFIQGLIENKVIEPCMEPTDWCAPGFFVVKADGKSVCLVTDYRKLNSFVERPVHPFPSVSEILRSIPATA